DPPTVDGHAGHPTPFVDLLSRRVAAVSDRKRGPPSLRRVESIQRRPLRDAIVPAHLGPGNRAAVQLPVVDDQRIDLRAVFADPAELLPVLAAEVPGHDRLRPGAGAQLS